jgi:hypothetical protein
MGNYDSYSEIKPETTNAKEIEIVFENKNTSISIGTEVGQYHSHPVFVAFETNGLWVGKFETTGTQYNPNIKPNQISKIDLDIKSMFESSYNYKRNNDSHMMKNTEWGAVSYLSHSKYGINKEININNNSDSITGYSAVIGTNQSGCPGTYGNNDDVTLPYNTETGYLASTTGNISGIYDMSGGEFEYMAAYMNGYIGDSGFDFDPSLTYGKKYFDIYNISDSNTSFFNRILGDATGELGPFYYYNYGDNNRILNNWYHDHANLILTTTPWFHRGSHYRSGIILVNFIFQLIVEEEMCYI